MDPITSATGAIPGGVPASCSGRIYPSARTAFSRRCAIVWYTGGDPVDSPRDAALCVEDSLIELLGGGCGGCLPSGNGVGGTATEGFPINTGGGGLGATGAGPEYIPMGIACCPEALRSCLPDGNPIGSSVVSALGAA